ncbi:MAG: hypothetical protein JO256_03075 [Alphaproteobacteria bacterium]|nr:hypothetical protein [Alphaproteobacteria bacterium]
MTEAENASWPAAGPAPEIRAQAVEAFAHLVRVATDRDQLRQGLGTTVRVLGFDHFALQGEGARLLLADLPANWIFRPDPRRDIIYAAAGRALAPFLWSDIPRLMRLSPEDAQTLAEAPPGFAVPLYAPGFAAALGAPRGLAAARGFAGCFSFLRRRGAVLPAASFAAAHCVAAMAFEAAQAVARVEPPRRRLSSRQRDCMILAARGKSDWEIGLLLGIGQSTVHKHIEEAKKRFGVTTRIQLVVRGLAEARLSFTDVLGDED